MTPAGMHGKLPPAVCWISSKKEEIHDGEKIWRDIRRWALQTDASSLRSVDEASTPKIPGKWTESYPGGRWHPVRDYRGARLERRGMAWRRPGRCQLLYAGGGAGGGGTRHLSRGKCQISMRRYGPGRGGRRTCERSLRANIGHQGPGIARRVRSRRQRLGAGAVRGVER